MADNPVRQHYVPQMLLRRFAKENGKLNLFFILKESGKFLENQNTDKVLLQKNIYTYNELDETTGYFELDEMLSTLKEKYQFGIEHYLSEIEGQAYAVLDKIENLEKLTVPEIQILKEFTYLQIYRTPWGREEIKSQFLMAAPAENKEFFLKTWEEHPNLFFGLIPGGAYSVNFHKIMERPFYLVTDLFKPTPYVSTFVKLFYFSSYINFATLRNICIYTIWRCC
ncbi:DUF4238 domain-containing protein [Clostridium tyrobutyricum]|uniref:DUF4238 domain-containing protein n=1 Tax=Clostridium tyrobutyricum TaxID=1519 RepID=UPI0018AA2756|nr:DUF4238 domain-containing protein [Clostridium tyrobutyricum]